IVVAMLLFVVQIPILNSFSALTVETRELAEEFIMILSLGIVLRSIPMTIIVGVLRAGGDVKFCLG
ncbi:MATE family efflux transporter, partial [Vibrio furnissii]